jgi:chemotaxis protein CheX
MVEEICLTEAVLGAAKEVFETMIFMDLEECSDSDRQIDGDALMGTITFKNNLEGCLGICCGESCAKAIATNMLGLESGDEVGQEDICDAIGEVANMVMGSVKTRLLEHVDDIQVSIPSVVKGRELINSMGDGANRISIKVSIEDEHIAELSLLCRENAPE